MNTTGGIIRPHFLTAGDALDRRKIEELFLWAAKRFAMVQNIYIGDGQLDRTFFDLDTFAEYQCSRQSGIIYKTPSYGQIMPGSGLEIINDDSYFEAEVSWSCEVKVTSGSSFMIMGWPVLDGQGVYGGEDWAEVDQLKKYAVDETDPKNSITATAFPQHSGDDTLGNLTLGNSAILMGTNGRSYAGVLIASIGKFDIINAQLQLRKVIR